jgi:hypothetical protein
MKLNTARLSGAGSLLLIGLAASTALSGNITQSSGIRIPVCLKLVSSPLQNATLITTQVVEDFSDNLVFTQSEGVALDLPTDLRLVSHEDSIDWRFPKFFLRMKGSPVPFVYYIVEEDTFVIARRFRIGLNNHLAFELWKRRKASFDDFIRVYRSPAFPDGNGVIANYHAGKRLLLIGTDEGTLNVVSTARHSHFARLMPPYLTAPDPIRSAEIAPDGKTVVVFHHNRMVEYVLDEAHAHSPIRDRTPTPHQYPIDRESYPMAFTYTENHLVKADSKGNVTFVDNVSHFPVLHMSVAELADPSTVLADGKPIVEGINLDLASGMVGVKLFGADRIIHIPSPEQVRGRSTKFNPLIWEKEARFFPPEIAADVLLGRAMYQPEYNRLLAPQSLRMSPEVYASQIAMVQQELRFITRYDAAERDAYRVLLYTMEAKERIHSVVDFLKRRSFSLVRILKRRDVLSAALYILEATKGRGTNPAAIFNQVEEQIEALIATLHEFKRTMPTSVRQKIYFGRTSRNSPAPEAFWLAVMKLLEMRVVDTESFWGLIERLTEETHPVESRLLSFQEILEAAHGVLFLTSMSPPNQERNNLDWLEELKGVISLLYNSKLNQSGTFPKFQQAERILALSRLDGAKKWEIWFNERESEQFQSFEQLLGRLELRRGKVVSTLRRGEPRLSR